MSAFDQGILDILRVSILDHLYVISSSAQSSILLTTTIKVVWTSLQDMVSSKNYPLTARSSVFSLPSMPTPLDGDLYVQ